MQDAAAISENLNIAWVLICGFFVFFMQAGFGMLESGLIRSKNSVNVIMKNFVDMCMGSIGYWLLGFGLMYGANQSGYFGSTLFSPNTGDATFVAFVFFQMMFAATAATIVSGALAERIRYWPYVFCALFICAVIYPVYGSWVWGSYDGETQGWLREMGLIDFAGSSVVHGVGGWCALIGLFILGPRTGRFSESEGKTTAFAIPGHNLPLATLGAFVLWFGFFAFNCGSTLAVDGSVARIALNTHLAGAAGVLGALAISSIVNLPTLIGTAINGGLGGMVAICASANTFSPASALLTGGIAGMVVMLGTWFLESKRVDDAVGAVAVHAFGGTWGMIAAGLFQPNKFFDLGQLKVQLIGCAAGFVWVAVMSFIMFKTLDAMFGLRVSIADERRGLDYAEHDEIGYPEFQDSLHAGAS